MQAVKLSATVPANRELKLRLPESIQPGRVEVLILREEGAAEPSKLLELLDEIEMSSEPGQSLEALGQRIREERDSWE
jgi:hypothetical protein